MHYSLSHLKGFGVQFDKLLSLALQNTLTQGDIPAESFRASVALIFKKDGQLCMIRRPKKEQDPWSGHMAFPGGREEESDINLRATAERETLEEVFIDLKEAQIIGRLTDLNHPRLTVSAFVYLVNDEVMGYGNPVEVAKIFWLPFQEFSNPLRQSQLEIEFAGRQRSFPVITIEEADVWGISLQFIQDLCNRMEKI